MEKNKKKRIENPMIKRIYGRLTRAEWEYWEKRVNSGEFDSMSEVIRSALVRMGGILNLQKELAERKNNFESIKNNRLTLLRDRHKVLKSA